MIKFCSIAGQNWHDKCQKSNIDCPWDNWDNCQSLICVVLASNGKIQSHNYQYNLKISATKQIEIIDMNYTLCQTRFPLSKVWMLIQILSTTFTSTVLDILFSVFWVVLVCVSLTLYPLHECTWHTRGQDRIPWM